MKIFYFRVCLFQLIFVGVVFVGSMYCLASTSIILWHITTEKPIIFFKYSSILQAHLLGFSIKSFPHIWCFIRFLPSHRHNSLFYFWFKLHFKSNKICFVFHLFIHIFIIKVSKSTSPVLLGIYFLLDRRPRVLQLTLHLSKIAING